MREDRKPSDVQEKVTLVLSSEEIDSVGCEILENNASQKEVILCLEGGNRWSHEIDALLQSEVLRQYRSLSEDEWIVLRVPIEFCFEIVRTAHGVGELSERLEKPPQEGYVLVFFLLESGAIVAIDASIEPSHASNMFLN